MRELKLDDLIAATGLSRVFAAATLTRLCERIGVSPTQLSPSDLQKLMPDLEKMLTVFLRPEEVAVGLQNVRALTR